MLPVPCWRTPSTYSQFLLLAVIPFLAGLASIAAQADDRVSQALQNDSLIWPPYVQGNLSLDIYNDYTVSADDPDEELNDLFLEGKLSTFVFFSRELYLESAWGVDPVRDPKPGQNRYFEDNALKWGVLALTYERENVWISLGKGPVHFGIAKDVGAGIYGADTASDYYSLKGRVGGSFNFSINAGEWGNHAVRAGLFTLDTSWLSTPFFSSADGPDRDRGGAGNTDSLKSYAVALDGAAIAALPQFRYHLGFVHQATDFIAGADGENLPSALVSDEQRYVLAVEWNNLDLGNGYSVSPLLEFAHLNNARGFEDRRESYLTGSLAFYQGQWNLALAATGWRTESADGDEDNNLLAQISGGYTFNNGLTFELGYRYLDEEGEDSHTIGAALNYELPFAF